MSDSYVSRRRFFVHSAHETVGVSAGPATGYRAPTGTEAEPWSRWSADQASELGDFAAGCHWRDASATRPLRVCLVSGCPLYKSDESLALLQEYLEKQGMVKCSRALSKSEDDLPGLESLEKSDCMLLFARRMTIHGQQLQRIRRYCRGGGAVVAVRTASHAFQNWLEMDKEVLGGDYQGHFGNKLTEVQIVEAAQDHPVLAGVKPFGSRGTLYKNSQIAKDATVLLTGTFPGQTYPVAWVRSYRGGRVFYTSLGHPADFRQPDFLRLLGNAITWTCAPRHQ
jgi:type 1 glutamine amidotransferase